MLVETKITEYDGASPFMEENCLWREVIEEFDIDLEEYKKYINDEWKGDLDTDSHEALYYYLNNAKAISDQEIIESMLSKKEGKYYVNFIETRNSDYFQIIEIKE